MVVEAALREKEEPTRQECSIGHETTTGRVVIVKGNSRNEESSAYAKEMLWWSGREAPHGGHTRGRASIYATKA